MLKLSLCDYNDAYIQVKGTVAITTADECPNVQAQVGQKIVFFFESCASFIYFITEINNNQVDNDKHLDVVMSMYHSLEYGENYPKTCENIYQYTRDNPVYPDGANPLVDPDK